MKNGIYRRTLKRSFTDVVSTLLTISLLAIPVSTQTTSPTNDAPDMRRQRRVKDASFREELLRQVEERHNDRPKIKRWEEIGPDDAGVATENRTGQYTKSEFQEPEPPREQDVHPDRTIVVHSTADDGPGSLRQALREATDGNKINIVVKGTITLTGGELVVDKSVTIRGHGASKLSVSGNFSSRVFHITPNTTVTISGLKITNGSVFGSFPGNAGGGIYNDHATLTVSGCVISGNSARFGGGIFSNSKDGGAASLTLNNSVVSGNVARFAGGGIFSGGGFFNTGPAGDARLTLNNTTVSNNSGRFYGGGIFNDGFYGTATVTVSNSALNNNSASFFGGCIYNNGDSGVGTVTLNYSMVSGNTVGSDIIGGSGGRGGGAIFNDGTSSVRPGNAVLTLNNSTVSDNKAVRGFYNYSTYGGGIWNYGENGSASLTLNSSSITGNFASHFGGGIYNDGAHAGGNAVLTSTNSTVSGNSAGFNGGGIYNNGLAGSVLSTLSDSTISDNSAGSGGGIYNLGFYGSATMTLTNCTVSGNSATGNEGGGIVNRYAPLTLTDCALTGNSAWVGGGILNVGSDPGDAPLTLTNSTVSGNSARLYDGGISNFGFQGGSATLTVRNSTISGNSAILAGGIGNVGGTGGITTLMLINSTLNGNSAYYGGAIHNEGDGGSPTVTLNNCTLSNNSAVYNGGGIFIIGVAGDSPRLEMANTIFNAGASGENIFNYNASGIIISHGYNLSSDAAGGDGSTGPGGLLNGPVDIRNTNPHLGPLQDNGGPTMTHALLSYSPAIDNGDPNFNPHAFNPPLLYDQRGRRFRRVVNGCVDIGAYELRRRDDDDDDDHG